ncbi:HSP20-like chaperone [Rhizopus microsporus var. microsporus]|uniref:HSP20-like chaperone n=2 Tax=Rhizopus microsporus TaxID=58291 RepID=A0A1X0QVR7_RHIZD|nr:HSP20-like chaperone [Rhizopus microsporus var. microsporus]
MALSNRFFADAFRDMHRAFSLLDDPNFFDDARRSLTSANNSLGSLSRYPATDINETAEGYELHAELPGYDKKDIHIDVADDRTLILSGSVRHHHHESSSEKQKQQEDKSTAVSKEVKSDAPKWWVNERVSGSFQRSFNFPSPIDSAGIKASYENGVLKICVPKAANQGKKRIEIS